MLQKGQLIFALEIKLIKIYCGSCHLCLQNMLTTLEKYIEQEYKKAGISIKVPKAVTEEITKKTRDIFALTNRGIVATFTNLPEFLRDIKIEKS